MVNLAVSVPTGLDNGISYFTGNRPFGTAIPGSYGIGGPPVNAGCVGPNCAAGPTPYAAMNTPSQFDAATLGPTDPMSNNDVDTTIDISTNVDTVSKSDVSNRGVSPRHVPIDHQADRNPVGLVHEGDDEVHAADHRERATSRPHHVRDLIDSAR